MINFQCFSVRVSNCIFIQNRTFFGNYCIESSILVDFSPKRAHFNGFWVISIILRDFQTKMINTKIQKCSIFNVLLLMNLCKSNFTNVTIDGTIEFLDSNHQIIEFRFIQMNLNSAWHNKWFL